MPRLHATSKYWVSRRSGAVGVVEGIGHRHAVQRHLLDAIDEGRLGMPGHVEDGGPTSITWWNWLRTSPLALNPLGQWTMVPVPGAAEVGGDLLGPLVGVFMAWAQPTA